MALFPLKKLKGKFDQIIWVVYFKTVDHPLILLVVNTHIKAMLVIPR